MCKIKQILH